MATKRRTSVLLDDALLKKARRALRASSNTEAITRALEDAVTNREIERSLRALIRHGRGRFVDVYR
jgi:Arc/MetJ family transcription regulator